MQEEVTGLTIPSQAQAKQGGWGQPENGENPKGREKSEPGLEDLSLATIPLSSPTCGISNITSPLSHHVWHQSSHAWHPRARSRAVPALRALGALRWFRAAWHKLGSRSEPGQSIPSQRLWVAGRGRRGSYRCLKSA